MLNLLSHKIRPIGLDIGHHSIKMLQLGVCGGEISVVAAQKQEIEAKDQISRNQAVSAAIKSMLQKGQFHGRIAVSCLPSEILKVKSVRIETQDEEEIEQLLKTDIAQRFGLNAEKDSIKYMVAGNVQQGSEIRNELLVFAADNESIKNHIALIEGTGLVPVGLDAIPCALFRSYERMLRRQDDKELVNFFVDVGSQFTTVVVGRGRDITFVKQIPLGGERFNTDIAARLGIDTSHASSLRVNLSGNNPGGIDDTTKQAVFDAISGSVEQLAREIALCFRYYSVTFRGSRPGKAVFTGGEAYESRLINAIRKQLGLDIDIAQPLKGCDLGERNFGANKNDLMCEWAVALGLSLKGWDSQAAGLGEYERN